MLVSNHSKDKKYLFFLDQPNYYLCNFYIYENVVLGPTQWHCGDIWAYCSDFFF